MSGRMAMVSRPATRTVMIWWTFSRGGADPPTVVCAPRARRRQGRDLAEGRGEVGAVGEPQEQRVLAGLTAEGGADVKVPIPDITV